MKKFKLNRNVVTALLAFAVVAPGAILGVTILWTIWAYVFGLILPWDQVAFGSFPVEDEVNRGAIGFIRLMGGMMGAAFSAMAVTLSRMD